MNAAFQLFVVILLPILLVIAIVIQLIKRIIRRNSSQQIFAVDFVTATLFPRMLSISHEPYRMKRIPEIVGTAATIIVADLVSDH